MSEGACNSFYGGAAMKPSWERLMWNITHILDFNNSNPHTKEKITKRVGVASYKIQPKAYQDIWASMKDIPISYARLCPRRAGTVHFWSNILLSISLISTVVLTIILMIQ